MTADRARRPEPERRAGPIRACWALRSISGSMARLWSRSSGTGLRRVRQGMFPGFSWLMELLDDAVLRARLRAGTDLILFRKVLLTLEGVLADVSADVKIDELLPWLFLRRLDWGMAEAVDCTALLPGLRDPAVQRRHRLADDATTLDPCPGLAGKRPGDGSRGRAAGSGLGEIRIQ